MIKLVVTDMDHTLLDDDSNLPKAFGTFVEELKAKDIQLVMASGRTLVSIKRKVKDYLEGLAIISDNGGIVEINGEIAYVDEISKPMQHKIAEHARRCVDTSIIAASVDAAYVELLEPSHDALLHEYYPEITYVDDITEVEDKIVKMTLMSPFNTAENYENHFKDQFEGEMNALMAGKIWIDVMNSDIDKGKGFKFLIDKLGIDAKDTIAFGDYHNDMGLLNAAGRGFAVENAHDDVKAIADGVVGSNNDAAVIQTTRRLIEGQ